MNKKEIVTPATTTPTKSKFESKAPEVGKKSTIEAKNVIPAVATQPQHFPTTDQFDTSQLQIEQQDEPKEAGHNWSSSFYGLSTEKFPKDVADILLEPVSAEDIEIKPGTPSYLVYAL